MIDSLRYIHNLEAAGIPRKHAVAQVGNMVDVIGKNLATREDFANLRGEFAQLKGEFADLKGAFADLRGEFAELKADFAILRSEFAVLSAKVESLETRLMVKLGGLMIGLFTVGSGVMAFVMGHAMQHP